MLGRAAVGRTRPQAILTSVDLPAPFGPSKPDQLSLLNLEVDALERVDAAVPLLQTVNREGGRCGGRHAASVRSALRARSGSKKAQTCDGFRDMLAVGRRLVAPDAAARSDIDVTYPKIELHVHLEGTVRPATLLEIAHRNDYALPVQTPRRSSRPSTTSATSTTSSRSGSSRRTRSGATRTSARSSSTTHARRPLTAPSTSRGSSRRPSAHAAASTGTRSSPGICDGADRGARAARRRSAADSGHHPRLPARRGA